MFVHGLNARNTAVLLFWMGLSNKRVGRVARVSPRTVSRWLRSDPPKQPGQIQAVRHKAAYAYLLGIYLGDGHITRHSRDVYRLWVHMDARYPRVIGEVVRAVRDVMPCNAVNVSKHPHWNSVRITSYSKAWPYLFPQHGPGRKHERKIWLAPWQKEIAATHPRELIRGLIHSDGCRFVARQRRLGRIYPYSRYCFSNRSRAIMRIFCNHLDLLEIHWTLTDPEQAQIARREAVEALDEFVGPKR
jgi:hypothetical protein